MLYVKIATIVMAATCLLVVAVRHREWRGGLLALACVFVSAAMNEFEFLFETWIPTKDPELVPIVFFLLLGILLVALNRGTTIWAFKAICNNRRFPLLIWGLCLVSFLPQLGSNKHVWAYLLPAGGSTSVARKLVENGIELLGFVFLFNWALLFLKDKRHVLARRVQSPHEHLLKSEKWEFVDCGTRRNCYKLGNSGFCVKFYKHPEECVPEKMKRSIRGDIAWRRQNKFRNSSSREVHIYNKLRHSMPEEIRKALPEVCERVHHPEFGWGVLESYCTNPDGTAVIPYEFEIKRQRNESYKAEIYRQAREMLDVLIANSAPFYEPGNMHPQFLSDGRITLRIVDFEVEPKMLIPLEVFWPWYRRRKLARKAKRYLEHIRMAYGVMGV